MQFLFTKTEVDHPSASSVELKDVLHFIAILFLSFSTTSVKIYYTLIICYTFRHFGHPQVFTFIVGWTACSLYWPVITVGIFCLVGLVYWDVMLPNTYVVVKMLNIISVKLLKIF
jgi:hypothetical protein